MSKLAALKFPECRSCMWKKNWRCVRCGAGEFFEEEITDVQFEMNIETDETESFKPFEWINNDN